MAQYEASDARHAKPACLRQGIRRRWKYAAMTQYEAERRTWTSCEAVNVDHIKIPDRSASQLLQGP